MPAHNRPIGSLPDIDEAVAPLSSLFSSGFNLATVESAAQLADRSIFVASDGSRFQFQRIPGENEPRTGPASPHEAPSPPSPQHQDPRGPNGFSIRRRPLSNAAQNYNLATGRTANGRRTRGSIAEPKVPTEDVTAFMGHLNINRFSATPLFSQSDGGVQAAETLTDPQTGPRYQLEPDDQFRPRYGTSQFENDFSSRAPTLYSRVSDYSPEGNASQVFPPYQPPQPVASPILMESIMEYSTPTGVLAPAIILQPSVGNSLTPPAKGSPDLHHYDTQTPVIVQVHAPSSVGKPSDGSSMGRDNVLPGEDMLYDGPVKSAQGLDGPYEEGVLRVFRNTLSNELRFHCKTGQSSETHWMKGINAQLVPVYAYDQRFPNHLFIRDLERDRGNNGYGQNSQANSRPSGTYQFTQLRDLLHFQAQLTGEKVVLDISSVRWVSVCRANSRTSKEYSSVRVQIWHEWRSKKAAQSDQASFVTAGTQLSGPLRDRLVPTHSRLMIFLGRLSEYITVSITDDIEVEMKGSTCVKLKPRKYGGFNRRNSRPGVAGRLVPKNESDAAGLDIHGQSLNAETEDSSDYYKTFEIEFESSPSQLNFVQAWNEVMEERRKQRNKLRSIQEEMKKETFSAKEALAIRT